MNLFILFPRISLAVVAGAVLLCASCKQQEQPTVSAPAPVPPVVTNSPATNDVSTNASVVTPEDARNHIGQTVTVRGKVDRVYVSQKGDVFIDIGGKHPNAPFTAICFQQNIPTADLQKFNGKVVSVKGKIKEYNGKVEIVLQTPDQISE